MTTEKSAVGSITSGLSIQDQINFNINKTSFQSPLQQTKSGIAVNDIVCRHNLQLVVKKDGSPACVKPQTAKKLVERGWLITNNQIAVSKVWVKIWSGQCHTDPWIDDWKKSHNTFPKWSSQKELFEIIKNYYEKQGIIVFGVNQSANWQNTENCGAGGYYYLLVANSDVNKMLEFGFTQSTTQNPVQIVSVKTIPTNPKVGDNLQFNLTIRNKANYPIYYGSTCGFPPLGVSFTPAESIQVSPSLPCACLAAPPVLPIPPNDTISWTYPQSCFGGTWTILKSGIIVVKSTFVWGITSLNPQTNVTSMVSTFNLLPNEEKNGTLSGNVSIQGGVACGSPMYPCKDPSVNYEVDVYANDGVTIVGKTFSDSNDHYSIQLPAGNYIVYTYPIPKQIPHPVSIIAGQNTIFDIAYDNGIR